MAVSNMNIRISYFSAVVLLAISIMSTANAAIGINWGRQSAQRLIPPAVVDLLLQNEVPEARIYTAEEDILKAFAGSGIKLTVSIFSVGQIQTKDDAESWVRKKALYFQPANVRRVYIGDHAFFKGLTDKPFLNAALNAVELMQNALIKSGYGDLVKATLPQPYVILKPNITKPSDAEFQEEIMPEMLRFLHFCRVNNAPFVLEFFPIRYVNSNNIDISFAFANNKSTYVVHDVGGAIYTNVFDFFYDCFAWALDKAGAPDIEIVVGQIGWPTDGYPGASAANAELFYKYLLPLVASDKGTPRRPGKPIDVYVHCLSDENKNPDFFTFARHWGIYRSNGEPKYKIDLSGQGRDIYPARAKGIMRMPDRWCVFRGNETDAIKSRANKTESPEEFVGEQFVLACKNADCTSLAPGGSCSHLSYEQNISYAFNMFFQSQFQSEEACDFEGLSEVVMENPSTGGCVFPVEVVKGLQKGFYSEGYRRALVLHDHETRKKILFVLLSVSFLWALF